MVMRKKTMSKKKAPVKRRVDTKSNRLLRGLPGMGLLTARQRAILGIKPFKNTAKKRRWQKIDKTGDRKMGATPQQPSTRVSLKKDRERSAKAPGYRTSAKTGRLYFERRENRSDAVGKNI